MSIDIKYQNHYKLYVFLKDKLIFESELERLGVKYFVDLETQLIIDNSIRYFLLDADREKIDCILQANEIIANTETITVGDYRDEKKYFKYYLIVAGVVVALMLVVMLVEKLR